MRHQPPKAIPESHEVVRMLLRLILFETIIELAAIAATKGREPSTHSSAGRRVRNAIARRVRLANCAWAALQLVN